MFKKIIVLSLLLLCSCARQKEVACVLEKENKSISIEIKANNDDISSFKVRTVFVLPSYLMADKDWLDDLSSQLDDSYHFEDNQLVSIDNIELDDTYSLNKTVEYLRKEKFYCE